MSGFEAIGLALAIVPILTEVATHYKQILEPVRIAVLPDHRQYKISEFYHDLNFETTLLREMLHIALDDTPSRGGSRTRADSIVGQLSIGDSHAVLQRRLGQAEEEFLRLVEDTLRTFEHVVHSKGVESSGEQTSSNLFVNLRKLRDKVNDKQRPASLHDIVAFSCNHSKLQKCMKKVRSNNKKLQRLLSVRSVKTLVTDHNSTSAALSSGRRVRTLLQTLYDAFSQRWNCSCVPPHRHKALLSLPCLWSDSEGLQHKKLSLMISTNWALANVWHESEISIKLAGSVRFSLAADATAGASNPTSLASLTLSPSRKPIDDFCPIIKQSQENRARLSIEYDGTHLWHLRPTHTSVVENANEPVTLSELFQQGGRISLKDKRTLAVILARSLLQFGDSPWLTHEWNKRDIVFLCTKGDRTDMKPYIATNFDRKISQTPLDQGFYRAHPNASILALGILLLELNQWNGIEKFKSSSQLSNGVVNANTELTMAIDALNLSRDDLHQPYTRAVDACLSCDFARDGEFSLHDESFRQGVQEFIITPLEVELAHGWPDVQIGGN